MQDEPDRPDGPDRPDRPDGSDGPMKCLTGLKCENMSRKMKAQAKM